MAHTTLLSIFNAPRVLCAEAVNIACYIRNRLINQSCQETCTFYEISHERQPNIGHFRTFGCKTFVFIPFQDQKSKTDIRAEGSIMVGHSEGDAYPVLLTTRRTVWNRKTTIGLRKILNISILRTPT